MVKNDIAEKWLKENGKKGCQFTRPKAKPSTRNKSDLSRHLCRVANNRLTVKEFVHRVRDSYNGDACIFVPFSIEGRPSRVTFCGRSIPAARYMALLTMGTPPDPSDETRHRCGNGHLSCVNPRHLAWGSRGENISDMVKHRKADTAEDRVLAVYGKL